MDNKHFNETVENLLAACRGTLVQKSGEYAIKTDRLAYFKKAASFMNTTPVRALFGMLAKHLVSLSDMCEEGTYTEERWLEKIVDSINYLALLWALLKEEAKNSE